MLRPWKHQNPGAGTIVLGGILFVGFSALAELWGAALAGLGIVAFAIVLGKIDDRRVERELSSGTARAIEDVDRIDD